MTYNMKEKTKKGLKIALTIVLRILSAIFKKKAAMIAAIIVTTGCIYSCVNGTMIVVKHPVSDLQIKVDTTGVTELVMKNDSVK